MRNLIREWEILVKNASIPDTYQGIEAREVLTKFFDLLNQSSIILRAFKNQSEPNAEEGEKGNMPSQQFKRSRKGFDKKTIQGD